MTITANIVDIANGRCFFGACVVQNDRIVSIGETGNERTGEPYLMPGFIDAHVHIESSMLVPTEFARLAVQHGTVATVSDPHEIANVLGVRGVDFMLENAAKTPFKFYFGVPSCVPATGFETAGDRLDADTVRGLLERKELCYLAEMMNYPGVLHADAEVMAKIAASKEAGKPIDGHAPGLTGADAIAYINAGITTDHECVSYDEARHKLLHGMKIIIREGSAAKNFEALHPLIKEFPEMIMFCSDDKHPDDLLIGHINALAARAVMKGYDWQDVLKAACLNPRTHYGLDVGSLKPGDLADMILVKDLHAFDVIRTWINGALVYDEGSVLLDRVEVNTLNRFAVTEIRSEELQVSGKSKAMVRVIRAMDGSLMTGEMHMPLEVVDGMFTADVGCDILKIVVVNRYEKTAPAVAFIHGFGLVKGAIASSVAHDSHNIVAVGVSDDALCRAINLIIGARGGVSATDGEGYDELLGLPVAGIISDVSGEEIAAKYTVIDRFSKDTLGSTLTSPFMTLSFMALLVIPQLKLSDKGLFDGGKFTFVDLALA